MLDVANDWLELTGQPRNATWDRMAGAFARPFVDPASPPGAPLYSFNYACAWWVAQHRREPRSQRRGLPDPFRLLFRSAYVPASACPAGRYGNRTQCSPLTSHPMPAGLVGMLDGLRAADRYGVSAATANNTVAATAALWGWGNATVGTNVWGVSGGINKACRAPQYLLPRPALPAVGLPPRRAGPGEGGGREAWTAGGQLLRITFPPIHSRRQARLGWSAEAVKDMLLYPALKNSYTAAGYNWAPGLCAYFPGNGGILLAAAALAGGFASGGAPPVGFPAQWHAVAEGFDVPYP